MGENFKALVGRYIPVYGNPVILAAISFPKEGLYYTENAFFLPEKQVFQHRRFEVSYDKDEIPKDLINRDGILANEIQAAKNSLEFFLSETHRDLYMSVFWSGFPYEFSEPQADPLTTFQLRGQFADELKKLCNGSRCDELIKHLKKVLAYPTLKFQKLP